MRHQTHNRTVTQESDGSVTVRESEQVTITKRIGHRFEALGQWLEVASGYMSFWQTDDWQDKHQS